MALTVCRVPGCPTITPTGICTKHKAQRGQARGGTSARGYGYTHQTLRAQWAPQVATGHVRCAKCNQPITAGEPWDLGHTPDRVGYTGPEHQRCNRATNGRERINYTRTNTSA